MLHAYENQVQFVTLILNVVTFSAAVTNMRFFQTELPNDVDIDLDEILDIEDENQRKKFIHVSLFQGKVLVLKVYLE